ncbi:MAG: polyhydroxyalkanoate synthesis repressor PhaR [Alphaproteobacteria bacterium]|nr:polyhydroxyalkanoate synthesis repressor PhaR [Alphaproteobacteria bacterium]
MAKRAARPEKATVIIKKYANRRLYDTGASRYITLDALGSAIRAGADVQVIDARTGEDITRSVLAQIIVEREASGHGLLSADFLRDIIRVYGQGLQPALAAYLELAMQGFAQGQREIWDAMANGGGALGICEGLARRNLDLFQKTVASFVPTVPTAAAAGDGAADDVAVLRRELGALAARLAKLEGGGG